MLHPPHGNSRRQVFICGGDDRPGDRDECPNELHDWPLPNGYGDAAEEAGRRLARGWSNKRCPDCQLYGWIPSLRVKGTTAENYGPVKIARPKQGGKQAPKQPIVLEIKPEEG